MKRQINVIKSAAKAAFPHTLPIMAAFAFIGITYGIYMHSLGFPMHYSVVMSAIIFAGSMEFIAANMLVSGVSPLYAFTVTLLVNGRHIFYGISMLDKYRCTGKKKWYLIYAMCDESFSINYTADIPPDIDRGWFMLFVSLFNHFYWVAGATLGALFGQFLNVSIQGLDFVLTALFIVIYIDQWNKERTHDSALLGLLCSFVCLLLFDKTWLTLASIGVILVILTVQRKSIERRIALR